MTRMFGSPLTPCPACEGSGCEPCHFTGFPDGRVPASVKAGLKAEGMDAAAMSQDLRRHPANQA